jgi:hypothetical protein
MYALQYFFRFLAFEVIESLIEASEPGREIVASWFGMIARLRCCCLSYRGIVFCRVAGTGENASRMKINDGGQNQCRDAQAERYRQPFPAPGDFVERVGRHVAQFHKFFPDSFFAVHRAAKFNSAFLLGKCQLILQVFDFGPKPGVVGFERPQLFLHRGGNRLCVHLGGILRAEQLLEMVQFKTGIPGRVCGHLAAQAARGRRFLGIDWIGFFGNHTDGSIVRQDEND